MSNKILKFKLKRVDPVKYATIAAFLTVLLMLIIFVPLMLLFSLAGIGAAAGSDSLGAGAAILGGGVFVIVLAPIIYGVLVFVITLITSSLLNFVLKKTGGLDVDFEKVGLDVSDYDDTPRIES